MFWISSSSYLTFFDSSDKPFFFSYYDFILSASYLRVLTFFSYSLSLSSKSNSNFFILSFSSFSTKLSDSFAAYINIGILFGFLDFIVSSNNLHFFSKSLYFLSYSSNLLTFSFNNKYSFTYYFLISSSSFNKA